jgi:hypothetical protein
VIRLRIANRGEIRNPYGMNVSRQTEPEQHPPPRLRIYKRQKAEATTPSVPLERDIITLWAHVWYYRRIEPRCGRNSNAAGTLLEYSNRLKACSYVVTYWQSACYLFCKISLHIISILQNIGSTSLGILVPNSTSSIIINTSSKLQIEYND